MTRQSVADDALTVLLPDDAEVTGEAHRWAWLAGRLAEAGVVTTADHLRRLPYDVVLSGRLQVRLDARGHIPGIPDV